MLVDGYLTVVGQGSSLCVYCDSVCRIVQLSAQAYVGSRHQELVSTQVEAGVHSFEMTLIDV